MITSTRCAVRVVCDDLPLLEKVCRQELAAELAREQQKH
jgi:hypothetical protein